jgi:hypothetical protein
VRPEADRDSAKSDDPSDHGFSLAPTPEKISRESGHRDLGDQPAVGGKRSSDTRRGLAAAGYHAATDHLWRGGHR